MSQLKILIAETDSNTIKTLKLVLAKKPSRMVGSGKRLLQEVASPSFTGPDPPEGIVIGLRRLRDV